jgi:hypothetical protein
MFEITQKIKNWIFRDTANLQYLSHDFGWITQIKYMAKKDLCYDGYLIRTGEKVDCRKLHKGNLIVLNLPYWQLPFITEKRIINNIFGYEKR